jgi:hypothetical protein
MIERLTSTLRDLAALSAADLAADASARLRDDCADAVRLELDCPQRSLTPAQRAALSRLSDALEDGTSGQSMLDAVRSAGTAIGLAASAPRT